jgi:nucleoside-diphosphate-sugar epimerase
VWGTEDGSVVDETTPAHPTREAGRVLLEAEAMLHTRTGDRGTALRFAGLYGPDRLPRLDDLKAGRPIAADPDSWLNLVHVDDAARIVVAVAAAPHARQLYVVSDGHPVRRRDWYAHLAARIGSPPPTFDTAAERTRGADKRVDPSLLFRDIPLTLAYPDSFRGIDAIV